VGTTGACATTDALDGIDADDDEKDGWKGGGGEAGVDPKISAEKKFEK
jgi:hypothetical protein